MVRPGQRTVRLIERVGVLEYGNRSAEEIIPVLRATLDIDRVFCWRVLLSYPFILPGARDIHFVYSPGQSLAAHLRKKRSILSPVHDSGSILPDNIAID